MNEDDTSHLMLDETMWASLSFRLLKLNLNAWYTGVTNISLIYSLESASISLRVDRLQISFRERNREMKWLCIDQSLFYRVYNVSFTRIKHQEKDNLPDEIIEKYTYSFSIFSHITVTANRKMQSSFAFVYVCFACYHLVTLIRPSTSLSIAL